LHIYKISGWKKVSKTGATYLSLSVNRQSPPCQQREEDEF